MGTHGIIDTVGIPRAHKRDIIIMFTPERRRSQTHHTSSPPRSRPAAASQKPVGILQWLRTNLWIFIALLAAGILFWCGKKTLLVFHWAEKRVDRKSPYHMFLFFAVTLPFNVGLPIPIVHQAWAVAIGCFFRWYAFPILVASMSVGVPLPFAIGRHLAARSGDSSAQREAWLRQYAPRATSYLTPLRRAIGSKPIRSAFLLMWAPLPTSSLPLLVGFLIPSSELRFMSFVIGALPSKLLHFACDVLVGMEAGTLAAALDAHDDLPGANEDDLAPKAKNRHARVIAIGAMVMTVSFVGIMLYTMHSALHEMKAKESNNRDEDDDSEQLLLPRGSHPQWSPNDPMPASPRARLSEGGSWDNV